MKPYPLLALMVAAAPCLAAPVPPPELAEAQLRALNHRLVDAHREADAAFLGRLAHRDFLHMGPDGAWRDREAFVRAPASTPVAGAAADDVRVRLLGPVGIVHGLVATVQADGGLGKLRATDVYTWDGEGWRLVSSQRTAVKDLARSALRTGQAPAHAPWPAEDPAGDDLAVLRALNDAYVRAFREADVAWYDAHLAPDYVVVYGDGSFHDRGAALADFAKPSFATHLKSFPVDEVNVRRFGDVAVIHAENAYETKDGRRGVNRYTDIWHRQDGRWRCVAAHITVHKAPS
jgi:uncharacterized protein (TIGR02246 family)